MCRKGGGARGAEGIELDESKLIELAVKICQSNPISTHGWVVAEIFSRQEHVDFAESRPVHGVDLPALEHQIVNLLRAHDRLWQERHRPDLWFGKKIVKESSTFFKPVASQEKPIQVKEK